MLVAEVPVLAPIGEVTVALTLFLTYMAMLGFLWVYRATLSVVLLGIAHFIGGISIPTPFGRRHPLGVLEDALVKADDTIKAALGKAASLAEHGASMLLNLAARQLSWIGEQIGGLAYDLLHALDRTYTVVIPHAIRTRTAPLWRRIANVDVRLHALRSTIAHELPRIRHRVRDVEHDLGKAWRRVRSLEKRFAPVAFAALVAAALTRMGLGILRCPKVLRTAKRTCGMDDDLLASLLIDTTMILGAVSIVQFAKEMQALTDVASDGIRHLIREA